MFSFISRIYQEYLHSRKIGNDLPNLDTRLDPLISIRKFRDSLTVSHCVQNTIVTITILFAFYFMELPIWAKILMLFTLLCLVLVPLTAQFFGYSLPVLSWVFLFFTSKYIPLSMKEPITVTVLPAVETILYADNLSQILASYTCTLLDIVAWIPYGLVHFAMPFIVAGLIWILAPPKTLRNFAWAFGFMNLIGVVIQDLLFPSAPPWYKVLHGLEKANYSIKGSPGGLGRIDAILGFELYTTNFTNSPLIFGALPSLHSACATMDCLWLCYLFPSFTPLWCFYVLWMWFSTMYLTHHYFVDLVAGSCLAVTLFGIVQISGNLPINDKLCRWSYETIDYYDALEHDPLRERTDVLMDTFSEMTSSIDHHSDQSDHSDQPDTPEADPDHFVVDSESDTDSYSYSNINSASYNMLH
ncbi:hypothetical protein FOA43_004426 [Brettanomyces nanus]|uniref:Phosphatidic acid phosphatase type 2/haloperoxidase domain-containing protein n=1 Tax=Eeniella nana TaxID=13502 RepID=A0A875SC08_EENNA|nr:uncharacterized protein FOA43_004426 [Brettanomyces nanus]QPG77029.1 hypothetical protein FOA43_004426 [Brettanomyces nanus]